MPKKNKRRKPSRHPPRQSRPPKKDIQNDVSPLIAKAIEQLAAKDLAAANSLCLEELRHNPGSGYAHNIIGVICLNQGDATNALTHFRKAISLDNSVPDFLFNKALTEYHLGHIKDCIESAKSAIALSPEYVQAWNTLGLAYISRGDSEAAKSAFDEILKIDENNGEAWVNLCGVLQELDEGEQAIIAGKKGVELQSDLPESFYNLARAYDSVERWEEAIVEYQKCISAFPDYGRAFINVSRSLSYIGEHVLAEKLGRNAIALLPDNSESYINTGLGIFGQARYADALGMYRKALEIDPDSVAAHNNIAHTALAIEEFSYGWEEYEYGFLTGHRGPLRKSDTPVWNGEDVSGKTIHVIGEQGIGEQLMFSTMIDDLVADGATVVFECEKRLAPLYGRSLENVTVVPLALIMEPEDPLLGTLEIDYRCAVGSLGRKYRTDTKAFKPRKGFLIPDDQLVRKCVEKYKSADKELVVGISWRSDSKRHNNHKNIPMDKWGPILQQPGCQFVSLQYGDVSEDTALARQLYGVEILIDSDVSALDSLEQSAAQIAACDLVISISNATVHLAGALGKEAWMMVSEVPCWHWFVNRKDSLWYDSVSIHRRATDRHWEPVIEAVANRLEERRGL